MRKQLLFMLTVMLAIVQGAWATGELTGIFSVSSTKKVQFSQGNLQAIYNGSAWSWAFATNQWDYVGDAVANNAINGNGTVSTNGTVDLFGWSTASTYYGINICTDPANPGDYSGDFRDWGNLAISNGGNSVYSGWRTLTRDEWAYLFTNHTYGYATVASVKGIIIVPVGYAGPAINSVHSDDTNPFARNTIDAFTWTSTYVPAGVVFLPAAGFRLSWIGQVQENAYYWTSTAVDATNKYATLLGKPNNETIITYSSDGNWTANDGFSVRLVKDVPNYTASFATGSGGTGWSISPTSDIAGTTVTVSYSGDHKVKSVSVTNKYAIAHSLAASAVGDIVCSDGKAYSVAEKNKLPVGVTAEAVVCYKSGSNGLAVALVNLSGTFGHEEAVDYSGSNYTGFCTAHPVSGQTWKVLSQDEFSNVYNGCGGTAPTAIYPADGYSGNRGSLDTYITNAGGTAMSGNYWTATTYTGAENCFVCTNILSGNVCNFNYNNTTYKLNVRYGFTF